MLANPALPCAISACDYAVYPLSAFAVSRSSGAPRQEFTAETEKFHFVAFACASHPKSDYFQDRCRVPSCTPREACPCSTSDRIRTAPKGALRGQRLQWPAVMQGKLLRPIVETSTMLKSMS